MTDHPQQSLIAADVEIKGTIRSAGSVRVDGKLDGELVCATDAVIGKESKIKGNIQANSVSVEGTIAGNISAKDRIELKATARVTGDIRAKRLTVEDGVTFVGRSEVNPSGQPIAPAASEGEPAANENGASAAETATAAAATTLRSLGRR